VVISEWRCTALVPASFGQCLPAATWLAGKGARLQVDSAGTRVAEPSKRWLVALWSKSVAIQKRGDPMHGRWIVGSALVLAVLVAPLAMGAGEGRPIEGGTRNPSANKTLAYTSETQILTENGTYGTRQSNKGSGGGAIYGCRSAPGQEPCIRANNLKSGRAFEFETEGTEGGFIEIGRGSPNTSAVPFNTNAAGKVTNLNADRVDDLSAEDIIAQARPYQVVFAREVSACAYDATIGNADTTEPPTGEIGVAQRAGNATAVSVVTRDSAGTKSDRPFHLNVDC
jgi:hypothetical protein